MQLILMLLSVAGVAVLDQWTKYLTVAFIPLGGHVDAIPGLFHLTYVQNTGAAFSMLQGAQWFFVLVFAGFTALVIWEYFKRSLPLSAFERWCVMAVYAGGLGNMIDRLRLGYVVDMICVDFMEFPVFNVADCFITCGCVAMIVSLVFFNRDFWKDEGK